MLPSNFELIDRTRTHQKEIMQAIQRERLASRVRNHAQTNTRSSTLRLRFALLLDRVLHMQTHL